MDNMLGLSIIRINDGLQRALEINEGDWSKKVWDIREEIKYISNLDESSVVLALTSMDTGHFLTVIKPIGGRITDCISAWIYIPATTQISGEELNRVIEKTKKEIIARKRDNQVLGDLFSHPYPNIQKSRMWKKSAIKQGKCAYRYYGRGTAYNISELLNDMSQPYYMDYKCVFLLDKSDSLECIPGVDDLTNKRSYATVEIDSPGEQEGFVPYLDGEPFSEKYNFFEDDELKFVWKKEGYKDIEKVYTVKTGVNEIPLPSEREYIKVIPYSSLEVLDKENNKPVREYKIYVEKKEVLPGHSRELSKVLVKTALIEIKAEGYKTYCREDCDLSVLPVKLFLERKEKPIKEQSSKDLNGKSDQLCPIIPTIDNMPDDTPRRKPIIKKLMPYVMVLCGFFGFLCGWVFSNYINEKKLSSNEDNYQSIVNNLNDEIVKLKKMVEGHTTNDNAQEYLEGDIWWRKEMEKCCQLKGLWDALNEMDFEKVLKHHKELKDKGISAEKLDNIIEIINKKKEQNITKGELYNKNKNAEDITVEKYKETVEGLEKQNGGKGRTSKGSKTGKSTEKKTKNKII